MCSSARRGILANYYPTHRFADLKDASAKGLSDSTRCRRTAIFLCAIYPVVGLLLARLAFGHSILPLLYPLVAGFALIGPVAALGLYELSRRRELASGSASHALDVVQSSSIGAIIALGLLLFGLFMLWVAFANAIYIANFRIATGIHPQTSWTTWFTTTRWPEPNSGRQRCRFSVRSHSADH